MQPKLLKVMGTHDVSIPEGAQVQLHQVELKGHAVFAITYMVKDVALYSQAHYFVCGGVAKQFFELYKIYADLSRQLTPKQEEEYSTFLPRSKREMIDHL